MPRRSRILVLGDINVDILSRVEGFAGLGADYLVPAVELHCGGVGANVALALARWGMRVRLLGAIGQDLLGEFLLGHLRQGGVDVSLVQRTPRALTGLLFTLISRDGERTFFGSRGANIRLRAPSNSRSWLRGVKAVHLVGYCFLSRSADQTARRVLVEARRRGIPISFDVGMGPARQIPQTILQVIPQADILFLSRDEAKALTGEQDARKALPALEEAGAGQVIVKLGERGCLFREGRTLRKAPTFSVGVKDTTGCGDAFTAAFLRGALAGWPLEEATLAANAAGAAAATVVGAGEQLPGPRAILRLLSGGGLPPRWEPVRLRVQRRLRAELRQASTTRKRRG